MTMKPEALYAELCKIPTGKYYAPNFFGLTLLFSWPEDIVVHG